MVKNLPANAGDVVSISGLGRSPGGVHGNPLQYSCLEKPMDRGAWLATVYRVAKSQTQLKQLRKDTLLRKDYTDIENKLMVTKGESGRLGLTYTHYYV